jgi:hypothetical protein
LLTDARRNVRAVGTVLLILCPLQFGYFYADYFGGYERRAAFYFDAHAFEDVAAFVLTADSASRLPAVYLSRQLDDAAPRWRFQLTKRARADLVKQLLAVGPWSMAAAIRNIDGADASVILRKAK